MSRRSRAEADASRILSALPPELERLIEFAGGPRPIAEAFVALVVLNGAALNPGSHLPASQVAHAFSVADAFLAELGRRRP